MFGNALLYLRWIAAHLSKMACFLTTLWQCAASTNINCLVFLRILFDYIIKPSKPVKKALVCWYLTKTCAVSITCWLTLSIYAVIFRTATTNSTCRMFIAVNASNNVYEVSACAKGRYHHRTGLLNYCNYNGHVLFEFDQ